MFPCSSPSFPSCLPLASSSFPCRHFPLPFMQAVADGQDQSQACFAVPPFISFNCVLSRFSSFSALFFLCQSASVATLASSSASSCYASACSPLLVPLSMLAYCPYGTSISSLYLSDLGELSDNTRKDRSVTPCSTLSQFALFAPILCRACRIHKPTVPHGNLCAFKNTPNAVCRP